MTTILALSPEEITAWQTALAVGGVVVIVVIALLGLLLHFVRSIRVGVRELAEVAEGLQADVGDLEKIDTLASTLDQVQAEASAHDQLLGRR